MISENNLDKHKSPVITTDLMSMYNNWRFSFTLTFHSPYNYSTISSRLQGCGISVEDLKFKNHRYVHSKFERIKHQFVYSELLMMLESTCYREGIELIKVNPAYTSKIGLYKYCHQYGMSLHNDAAMVIGRLSYKFKEKFPKILKNKFIESKLKDKFNFYNEWKKWSMISKNIIKIRKEVKNPDLWLGNRKELIGLG